MSKGKGLLRTLGELFSEIRSFGNAEANHLKRELQHQKAQLEQLKLAQEERKRFEEKLALAELRRAVESMQGLDAKLRSKEQEVIAVTDELGRDTERALERMLHQRAADILAAVDFAKVVSGEEDVMKALQQAEQQAEQQRAAEQQQQQGSQQQPQPPNGSRPGS